MPELRKKYPFDQIEPKWQQYWRANKIFAAKEDATQPKFYVLDMFPYPSGAGLHVGHPEGYTVTDIFCRFKRMHGFNVLHPMGWDAFGLPAEQYAIDTGTHPSITTKKNIDTFRRQIQMLGFSYDWDREVNTTDPHYFKWTQWIFLQLFNSYYDHALDKAMPIALLEDALSENPNREMEWKDNPFLTGTRIRFFARPRTEHENLRRSFIRMMRLAREAEIPVWWCEGCKAVLANEEVNADGTCDRKGHKEVYRRPLRQWILRITEYAERLLDDLKLVNWPESIKEQQRNWIGRSEGANVEFRVQGSEFNVKVFTTRPDTLFGATYMVLAPEHPLVDKVTTAAQKSAVDAYQTAAGKKSELERTQLEKDKTGVFTGGYAINPVNSEQIPIWVADYVMMGYGTGAIMAVPAHDTRDFEFAKKFDLDIVWVVDPIMVSLKEYLKNDFGFKTDEEFADWRASTDDLPEGEHQKKRKEMLKYSDARAKYIDPQTKEILNAFADEGISVNSPPLVLLKTPQGQSLCNINGLKTSEAKKKIIAWLGENNLGEFAVNYKLRDWLFSRQRYWGEPIPIVHCAMCGTVPVPENELPLQLPEMKDYSPSGNAEPPLAKATDWVNCSCPQCGGPGTRETNTMPQWAGSCWYYLRYIDPHNGGAFIAKDKEKCWMPVDLYVGGAEHAVLHLLYSRFWHKVLFDLGHVSTPEPFTRLVNQGMILGEDNRKMSKSWGNVINPDDVVREYGADTLRLYEMFMGPLEATKPWSMQGVEGVYRFLGRVWRLFCNEDGRLLVEDSLPDAALLKVLHQTLKKVTADTDALAFNTAIAQMMIFVNEVTAQPARPRRLLEPFVLLLSPYAPHLAEELWAKLNHTQSLAYEPWPTHDPALLVENTVQVVVQVNGKIRARLDVPVKISKEELEKLALGQAEVQPFLAGKQVKKVIVISGKLVNIAVG